MTRAQALRDFIRNRRRVEPRPETLAAFRDSLADYDSLYRLAQ